MADKIKEMLEEALRKGNKTPKQVADYLHISLSTFSRMRNNPLDASVRNLYNYVVYLGIPSQKIFDILGYGHYLKIPMSISFECQTQEEFQKITDVIQQFNKKEADGL